MKVFSLKYNKIRIVKSVFRLFTFTVIAFLAPANGTSVGSEISKHTKPNFLFILTDDQAYSAMGAAGNHQIKTPNLDRLAASGTQFTHVYNQGSWSPAVCAPSRAMINTGEICLRQV